MFPFLSALLVPIMSHIFTGVVSPSKNFINIAVNFLIPTLSLSLPPPPPPLPSKIAVHVRLDTIVLMEVATMAARRASTNLIMATHVIMRGGYCITLFSNTILHS